MDNKGSLILFAMCFKPLDLVVQTWCRKLAQAKKQCAQSVLAEVLGSLSSERGRKSHLAILTQLRQYATNIQQKLNAMQGVGKTYGYRSRLVEEGLEGSLVGSRGHIEGSEPPMMHSGSLTCTPF